MSAHGDVPLSLDTKLSTDLCSATLIGSRRGDDRTMSNPPMTRRDSAALGLTRNALERGDNPFHGVWTPTAATTLAERCRAMLAASPDDTWFSHVTAASAYGPWIP